MPKRDPFVFAALGLVGGLGLALLFLVWAVPEFRSPTFAKQYYSDWQAAAQATENGTLADTHFWIRELYGWVYAEDTLAQWLMVVLGIAATTISLVALIWLRRTWHQAKSSADAAWAAVAATRELGKDQARAYVHVDSAELRWGDSKASRPYVTFTAVNTGQTPAKYFECHATFFLRKLTADGFYADNVTFDDIDLTGISPHRWNALGGGRDLTFAAGSKSVGTARSSYGRTDVSLDVAGILRYETFFGEIFETEFWFTIRPPPAFNFVKTINSDAHTPHRISETPSAMQCAAGSLRTYHRVDSHE